MLREVSADIIWVLHIVFTLSILIVPFTNNDYLLNLYKLFVPFLFFQWSMTNSKCFLSTIEARLRGTKEDETFIARLIHPVYNINNEKMKALIHMFTLFLYLLVLYRTKCVKIYYP